MLIIVLATVIIILLFVIILILLLKKPKDDSNQFQQLTTEQNVKFDALNANVSNISQISSTNLQNMNQQLNNVYRSIGKIQSMSNDVSHLRKILANVKQRGIFAEMQLKNILDQTIPGMYESNVKPNPRSDKIVEFAIKIPSIDDNKYIWLPIDSKFPLDKYTHLVEASESDNSVDIEVCRKSLISSIDFEATKIKDKYISEPYTTPFAIMFLANEGMYMEAVNDPSGLQDKLQRRGIMIAGPSTILALLNSLSLGFRSIQINKNAGEIQKMLINIKQQFIKFEAKLNKIEDGLSTATKALDDTKDRSRKINNVLDKIEDSDIT